MCRADGDLGKNDVGAVQTLGCLCDDITAVDVDFGAERLEARQMQIDRARADGAATGQRDFRLAHAGDDGTEDPEAGAHTRDHFVGCGGVDDIARGEMERLALQVGRGALAVDGQIRAVIAQDAGKKVDVGEVGNVLQSHPVGGQQTRDHQRQGGVLGPGNGDRPRKPLAADNSDAIHGVSFSISAGCGKGELERLARDAGPGTRFALR